MKSDSFIFEMAEVRMQDALALFLTQGHHDPFSVLGYKFTDDSAFFRAYRPGAVRVSFETAYASNAMQQKGQGIFEWSGTAQDAPLHPTITAHYENGQQYSSIDAYSFLPDIENDRLTAFGHADTADAYAFLGAHLRVIDGVEGVRFAVWAPNARRVSVVGDFNLWDGRQHGMRNRGDSGIWELFIPGVGAGILYKYEVVGRNTDALVLKSDPFGQLFRLRPDTAGVVAPPAAHEWQDERWMQERAQSNVMHTPLSIYEIHLGSWKKNDQGNWLNYRELAHELARYVHVHGFTHVQLLPVTEYPFDGSWGYQVSGYFAPTSRFGAPDDFRYFVDHLHQQGIGVILDWVPGHFPKDEHGLARFDGTALFEHEDPRKGEHREWGTLIFNYGRREVVNFLLSSAEYWLREFHIDGLRVDAVASMLYLDYAREEGDWAANEWGGNENLEAIAFLRRLNILMHQRHAGVMIIAEESTAWPQVSRPVYTGGLGFTMKWNMGWMNDTLSYFARDTVFRKYHHEQLTFSLMYAFSENFVLPLSHDEVVHGKRSLLSKMPGDEWQRYANLRLMLVYLFMHPGKKLLFMGGEIAQVSEWNYDTSLEWWRLQDHRHAGMQKLVCDLNHCYRSLPALHWHDFEACGFQWLDCHDHEQSVISFLRHGDHQQVLVILNFTPVPRHGYRVGIPQSGHYRELLNSDSRYYGGSNVGNSPLLASEPVRYQGFEHSVVLTLPPLAGVVLVKE